MRLILQIQRNDCTVRKTSYAHMGGVTYSVGVAHICTRACSAVPCYTRVYDDEADKLPSGFKLKLAIKNGAGREYTVTAWSQ